MKRFYITIFLGLIILINTDAKAAAASSTDVDPKVGKAQATPIVSNTGVTFDPELLEYVPAPEAPITEDGWIDWTTGLLHELTPQPVLDAKDAIVGTIGAAAGALGNAAYDATTGTYKLVKGLVVSADTTTEDASPRIEEGDPFGTYSAQKPTAPDSYDDL